MEDMVGQVAMVAITAMGQASRAVILAMATQATAIMASALLHTMGILCYQLDQGKVNLILFSIILI